MWKKALISGWGPFEMIDMCAALGIEPIITLTALVEAEPSDCCSAGYFDFKSEIHTIYPPVLLAPVVYK